MSGVSSWTRWIRSGCAGNAVKVAQIATGAALIDHAQVREYE